MECSDTFNNRVDGYQLLAGGRAYDTVEVTVGRIWTFGKLGRHHRHDKRNEDFYYWHALRAKMKDMPLSERREYIRKHMRERCERRGFESDMANDNKE